MLTDIQFSEELRIRRDAVNEQMSRYKPETMPPSLLDEFLAITELETIVNAHVMDEMEARLVWEEAVDEAVK